MYSRPEKKKKKLVTILIGFNGVKIVGPITVQYVMYLVNIVYLLVHPVPDSRHTVPTPRTISNPAGTV